MSYTTIASVRDISGLDNTTNIADSVVQNKIDTAVGYINGYVGAKYSLPLPYRRASTLTFAGTGTGSATMTITIDSVAYAIAISNGLTAAQAAALFRVAVFGNDSFYFNAVETGASITIISKTKGNLDLTEANDDVTIDSGATTQGISLTQTSLVNSYPSLIKSLTTDVAAALLLMDNYGIEAQDTPKDGEKRLNIAFGLLNQILGEEGKTGISIFDEAGEELTRASGGLPSFLPNDTTSDSSYSDPTNAKITINQTF